MSRQVKKTGPIEAPKAASKKRRRKGKSASPVTVRWVAFFVFILAVLVVGNYDLFIGNEANRIRPGVTVGPIEASGKTTDEVTNELRQFLSGYQLTFVTDSGNQSIGPFVDDSQNLIDFNVQTAVDAAYGVGRHRNTVVAVAQRFGASLFGTNISVPYSLNEDAIIDELENRFGSLVSPAENASLRIVVNDDDSFDIEVLPEKDGVNFDSDSLLAETRDRLRGLSTQSVKLSVDFEEPDLSSDELEPLVETTKKILERAPQPVTAKELSWIISRRQLADWVVPMPDARGHWSIALDNNRMAKHLEAYTSAISIEPQDAIFEMGEDGRVARFTPGIDGEKLDLPAAIALLEDAFLNAGDEDTHTIDLPVTVAEPAVTTASSNEFGIRELLGVGESNFRGSPSNRRHNIKTGADSLNGILVPPGEEFSLITSLGSIDGEHGYLEELVIKQNETKPEFGGGLCQIGTTTFRAVMNSGLPVTERRNHSYRVSYYERDGDGNYIGPGLDATIYDPWPDFKFKNDTAGHVLIQTAIDGDRLSFYFWGTDDGRKAEKGEVSIWNVEDPPPRKEIYTTALEPGKVKCTEHPHPSASTVFTYTVTYPDGEVKEEKIYSYYKPWQEVCAVGVTAEELAQKEAEAAAAEAGETEPTQVIPDGSGIEEAEG